MSGQVTVGDLLRDEETGEELRAALDHNVAVLAISPTHTIEEARELLRARLFVTSAATTRARLRKALKL